MTIFRSRGFDSLIGKNTVFAGEVAIAPDSTLQVDGEVIASRIIHCDEGMGDVAGMGHRIAPKTTLHVNGKVRGSSSSAGLLITVHNVIVAGILECAELRVEGTLAIKAGAKITATKILYRDMIIETGAVVHGQMFHLDHVSEGEQV